MNFCYSIILGIVSLFCCMTSYALPRLSVYGTFGSREIAGTDSLAPIFTYNENFFFSSLQAKVANDHSWVVSPGIGYRYLWHSNQILGTYFFLDRNVSENDNIFYDVSPGIEVLNLSTPLNNIFLDYRANFYFPVGKYSQSIGSLFPTLHDTCGINDHCDRSIFIGHKQFAHQFKNYEQVGNGAEVETAIHLSRRNNFTVYAGAYYFNYKETRDLKGIEARLELPIQRHFTVIAAASHDNVQGNAIELGVEFKIGGSSNSSLQPLDARARLYDRIPRYLSTVKSGSGIPVARFTKDEGLFLIRDNIFFFESNSKAAFDGSAASGTFENPLAPSELTQATLEAIATITPNANFFFAPGTYSLPSQPLNLLNGQSFYGRDNDFRCSAVGDRRAVFLGEMSLSEGNNTLDSIQLVNSISQTSTGANFTLAGLDVNGARNVHLCNDVIDVSSTIVGNNNVENNAIGIRTHNGELIIDKTTLNVSAIVEGDNTNTIITPAANGAVGIGNVNGATTGNAIVFKNSQMNVSATVTGNNSAGSNTGVGIGNLIENSITNSDFTNNQISLIDDQFSITSTVQGVNGSAIASGTNISVGISNSFSIASTVSINNNFANNIFVLKNDIFNINAIVNSNNSRSNNATNGIGFAMGIEELPVNISFTENQFTILNTNLQLQSIVQNDQLNRSSNQGTVIGINGGINLAGGITSNFTNNLFNINKCKFDTTALIGGSNIDSFNQALNIGIIAQQNSSGVGSSAYHFDNNTINIDSLIAKSNATVTQNNTFTATPTNNESMNIGFIADPFGLNSTTFANNHMFITGALTTSEASVLVNNSGANLAYGFNVGDSNIIVFTKNKMLITAHVVNNLAGGVNQAFDFVSGNNTLFEISETKIEMGTPIGG